MWAIRRFCSINDFCSEFPHIKHVITRKIMLLDSYIKKKKSFYVYASNRHQIVFFCKTHYINCILEELGLNSASGIQLIAIFPRRKFVNIICQFCIFSIFQTTEINFNYLSYFGCLILIKILANKYI